MVKGVSAYLREAWKKPKELADYKGRLIEYRKSNAITRIEKPTRLDKAHALGYKAKTGFVVVRVRLMRGGRKRSRDRKGRRSKRQTIRKTLMMNYRWVAEIRAENRFKNLVVLNSYPVGKDGKNYFYEVIMVDPTRPEIKADKDINWVCDIKGKGRVVRGLTGAGKKSRGLAAKGTRRMRHE